jgi:RNA polymerase sigma-70 factor, ECF subfamily
MKVLRSGRPYVDVSAEAAALTLQPKLPPRPSIPVEVGRAAVEARPGFAAIYDAWFDHVSRWLLALGAPPSDNEDLAQEVFLVVQRRLHDFDHRNVAGWLFRIASRQVAAHKRRRWWKSVLTGRREDELEGLAHDDGGPAAVLEKKERQRALERLLRRMNEKRRTTFVLFEIEGYSGEEIARLQGIPVATVWTRLHHARKEFFALVAEHRGKESAS